MFTQPVNSAHGFLPLPPGEGWGEGEISGNYRPHPALLPRGEGTQGMLRGVCNLLFSSVTLCSVHSCG